MLLENQKYVDSNFLVKKSVRHHYIPRFLIKGFENSKGLLYIFDKDKNQILRKPRPPKSIFFEANRNTLDVTSTIQSSIIEDYLFSKIDSETAKCILYFQNTPLKQISFSSENLGLFEFFLITLYWRIPFTDPLFEALMNKSEGVDPILKNDVTFRKIQRAGLFKHHIDEVIKKSKKEDKTFNIHQSDEGPFILGDNPLLFKSPPIRFSAFTDSDYVIALSSKRLFSSTHGPITTSGMNNFFYNASIIQQSQKYVASSSLIILEKSVKLYNELKKNGLENSIAERAFN